MVITHLQNRATSPLGSVACENYLDTGKLGEVVKVKRLVAEVIHCLTGNSPFVIGTCEHGAYTAETIEDMVVSNIIAEAEARMHRQCGHKAIRSPGASHIFEHLVTVDTKVRRVTVHVGLHALEIVLIDVGFRVTDFTSGSGESITGTSGKLSTGANPVLHPVAIIIGDGSQPRCSVIGIGNRRGQESLVVNKTAPIT